MFVKLEVSDKDRCSSGVVPGLRGGITFLFKFAVHEVR